MTSAPGASPSRATRRRLLLRTATRVLLTIAVLWALVRAAGLERVHFRHVQPLWIGLGLVTAVPQMLGVALRWRFTAARVGLSISLPYALREYYVSSLLNQVLPGGIAGDGLRAVRHGVDMGAERSGYALPLRVVLLERFAGQLVVWAVVIAGLPLWLSGSTLLACAAIAVATLLGALLIFRVVRDRGLLPEFVRMLLADASVALLERRALLVQLGTSLLTLLGCVAMFGCAAKALSAPLELPDLFRIAPLALATMTLPVSFAGWGVRELASSALYAASGLDPAMGAATSILYGLLALANATPGAAFLWLRAGRTRHGASKAERTT